MCSPRKHVMSVTVNVTSLLAGWARADVSWRNMFDVQVNRQSMGTQSIKKK